MPRVGLAAPADQELRGRVLALRDLGVRHRAAAVAARRLRDDRERRRREPGQIVARLLGVDVDELLRAPTSAPSVARPACRSAGTEPLGSCSSIRSAGGMRRVDVLVDEQAPDVLERVTADELLDVDAAIAKRAAVLVGLRDLRLERDDAFEAGRKSLAGLIGANGTANARRGSSAVRSPAGWPIA